MGVCGSWTYRFKLRSLRLVLLNQVMDVEDEVSYKIRLALLREERYCYPVGAVLGGGVGLFNEYFRQEEDWSSSFGTFSSGMATELTCPV